MRTNLLGCSCRYLARDSAITDSTLRLVSFTLFNNGLRIFPVIFVVAVITLMIIIIIIIIIIAIVVVIVIVIIITISLAILPHLQPSLDDDLFFFLPFRQSCNWIQLRFTFFIYFSSSFRYPCFVAMLKPPALMSTSHFVFFFDDTVGEDDFLRGLFQNSRLWKRGTRKAV